MNELLILLYIVLSAFVFAIAAYYIHVFMYGELQFNMPSYIFIIFVIFYCYFSSMYEVGKLDERIEVLEAKIEFYETIQREHEQIK